MTVGQVVRWAYLIAIFTGAIVCYAMIMWQFLAHRKWKLALLSLVFVPLPFCWAWPGFLIALILGWQEAGNWNMKKLMRIYSIFFVLITFPYVSNRFEVMMKGRPEPPRKGQYKKAVGT
jgi:hypothetical protein